jgi:transposase-like protein
MEFKWRHFQKEIILWGMRWYVAYPMSYRQLEEFAKLSGAPLKKCIRSSFHLE